MSRRKTPEELALIKAQTDRLGAETAQSAQELGQKAQIAREQMGLDRLINDQKVGLGREEIGSKTQQSQLGAALDAMKLDQVGKATNATTNVNALGDLAHRGDIPIGILADAYKSGGHSELANALDVQHQRDRERLITANIPALINAKSDAAREKGLKPAFANYPGAYEEALARAFPKPGVDSTPRPEPTVAPATRSTTDTGVATSPLANELLKLSGVNVPTNNVTASVEPELNYTGIGHGALEGSQRTELPNGQTQLNLPSGGTARVFDSSTEAGRAAIGAPHDIPIARNLDTGVAPQTNQIGTMLPSGVQSAPREVPASNRLDALINPQGAPIESQPQYGGAPIPFGAFHGALGGQPVISPQFAQLVNNQPTANPVPNPTPVATVAPTTPLPVAAETPIPNANLAAMLELARQKKLQNQ